MIFKTSKRASMNFVYLVWKTQSTKNTMLSRARAKMSKTTPDSESSAPKKKNTVIIVTFWGGGAGVGQSINFKKFHEICFFLLTFFPIVESKSCVSPKIKEETVNFQQLAEFSWNCFKTKDEKKKEELYWDKYVQDAGCLKSTCSCFIRGTKSGFSQSPLCVVFLVFL